jgi:hypothetical protein
MESEAAIKRMIGEFASEGASAISLNTENLNKVLRKLGVKNRTEEVVEVFSLPA